MAAYVVTVYGDLRDVDTGDHIIEWFKGKLTDDALNGKHFWPRQAMITVNEEYKDKDVTWVWEHKGDG